MLKKVKDAWEDYILRKNEDAAVDSSIALGEEVDALKRVIRGKDKEIDGLKRRIVRMKDKQDNGGRKPEGAQRHGGKKQNNSKVQKKDFKTK